MGIIADKLNYLNTTKENIKNAIVAKGVSVSDSDTFRSYASKIADIEPTLGTKTITANGTYTASDDSLQGYSSVTVDIDDTDLYRDTTDNTYESVKTLSNCGAFPMLSLTAEINAVQDLHGYGSPWVGGAGKNKLQISATSQTLNGVAFTVNSDGTINTSNTATGTFSYILFSGSLTFAQDVIINGCPENGSLSSYALTINNGATTEAGSGITIPANTEITTIAIRITNGTNMNGKVFKPMIRLASVQDATFAPYSNICPISGWDEANITVADDVDNPTVSNVYTIDLNGTRYGGTLDVVSGVLKVVPYYASYNGETLEGEWISDRDVYAVGTTPTIGAQVVNIGATPTTYQLTPTQVKSLLGTNNVWADTGDVGDARYFRKVEL